MCSTTVGRAFGFRANSGKAKKLAAIRALLDVEPPPPIAERLCLCPVCGKGQLTPREMLEPWSLLPRSNTS
jgi:hypothetical protein